MGILESSLVSTRNIISGFVEFIIAYSWDTHAWPLVLLFIFAQSGVDV